MESSNIQSWSLLNKPREKIAETWLVSPTRREYHNYVLEDPETYDGRGFNMYRGRPVEPIDGDVSLFKRYLLEVLCGGDPALAHWVTSWVADGVQRPWTVTPGTALALRGPQGSGKSFLGYAISKVLGDDLTLAVVDSNYLTGKGNREMFGKTFLLAEESLFVGSQRGANVLKNLVTRPDWRYEQKYLASFAGKNVHRLIATTNGSQAVLLDFDDRRWTVIEVNRACPFKSTSMEARQWWAPFYDLVENHSGVILKYLLDYPVDRDLIGRPHHTAAKAEDKTASDPLIALFHAMALTGVCPDDMRGDGRIATATLAREVIARGGSRQATSQTFSNDARKRFGATSAKNCIHIERLDVRSDGNGVSEVRALRRTDKDGIQMPPLDEFRRIMAEVTDEAYPEIGEWGEYQLPMTEATYSVDPNGGDADEVERLAALNRKGEQPIPF